MGEPRPILPPLVADRSFLLSGGKLSRCIDDYGGGIVLPIDKPLRWTSADVIRRLKFASIRHFGKKNLKIGHAGTLDPLATGVLLVCIGKATRMAEELQRHSKEYRAGISFGATTPSYDLEKEIDMRFPTDGVGEESLRKALEGFIGEQQQVAPLFSAKSVDGVRAYELARKAWKKSQAEGSGFDHAQTELLSTQSITIFEAELLGYSPDGVPAREVATEDNAKNMRIHMCDNSALHLPHADVRIACTKGTYIRAFARDLGEALGSGAHLDSLCRSRSGDFKVENALDIDQAMSLFEYEKKV